MRRQILVLWLLTVFILTPLPVCSECRLPVPDGGDETYVPSKENLFGNIERVELPYAFVRNGKTQRLEQISVSKITEIYTVYGGDAPVSELKPKLQVWVWFENCKRPKEGIPNAAYFQIFSTDPLIEQNLIVKVISFLFLRGRTCLWMNTMIIGSSG